MNKSTFRSHLRLTIQLLGLTVLLGFAFIFLKGALWTPNNTKQVDNDNNFFAGVPLGSTKLIRKSKQRFWISHLSKHQFKQLKNLSPWVEQEGFCSNGSNYCAINADTESMGVILRFTQQKPPQLNTQTPWFGGFVNPVTSDVYDLLGRKYTVN